MNDECLAIFKFGKRQYMEDFRTHGIMYLNPLSYFVSLEGEGDIGDKNEGLNSYYQASRVNVKFSFKDGSSILLTEADGSLEGTIKTKSDAVDSINIFCMYALKYRKESSVVDERNFVFGDTYVCITNFEEFINRIRSTVEKLRKSEKRRINLEGRFIEYVDENTHNGEMGLWKKFEPYRYQSEYRFCMQPGFDKPYKLELGNLSDISVIDSIYEINQHIEIVKQ